MPWQGFAPEANKGVEEDGESARGGTSRSRPREGAFRVP